MDNATVPVIETGTGICHVYVDADADLDKALTIVDNAKTSRPSVCNAAEVCRPPGHRPRLPAPAVGPAGGPPAGPPASRQWSSVWTRRPWPSWGRDPLPGRRTSTRSFWTTFWRWGWWTAWREAIDHINRHSTGHSEAILTQTRAHADLFTKLVDSAAVYVNVSTRFTDGGEFGLGCEMGISTQKLHARGPMGLEELTSYKYIILGDGQIR